MTIAVFDVEAARARFSSLRSGFAFFDAPGGTQVPDEVGEAIAAALRDASGQPRRAVRDRPRPSRGSSSGAKEDAARFLGCTPGRGRVRDEHDDAELRDQPRRRRDFTAGDEILTTALDHDGGVAPWVELAADKGG